MKHYNPTLSNTMNKRFALKGESTDLVEDSIYPIYAINPIVDVFGMATRSSSGTSGVFTASSTKDTYITQISASLSCDVNANVTQFEVYSSIGGANRSFLRLAHALGAAGSQAVSITFENPIKLDRGQVVNFALISAVGVFFGAVTITAYTMETLA